MLVIRNKMADFHNESMRSLKMTTISFNGKKTTGRLKPPVNAAYLLPKGQGQTQNLDPTATQAGQARTTTRLPGNGTANLTQILTPPEIASFIERPKTRELRATLGSLESLSLSKAIEAPPTPQEAIGKYLSRIQARESIFLVDKDRRNLQTIMLKQGEDPNEVVLYTGKINRTNNNMVFHAGAVFNSETGEVTERQVFTQGRSFSDNAPPEQEFLNKITYFCGPQGEELEVTIKTEASTQRSNSLNQFA
jgi:hypothetical protein